MLPLVASCNGCPNREYGSGGFYDCTLTRERIPNDVVIAPFCPLADYPAATIAAMEKRIRALEEPQKFSLVTIALSYVGGKFGILPDARYGSVTFNLEDGSQVVLRYDGVTEVDVKMSSWDILFQWNGRTYKAQTIGDPTLYVYGPSIFQDAPGMFWHKCKLSH